MKGNERGVTRLEHDKPLALRRAERRSDVSLCIKGGVAARARTRCGKVAVAEQLARCQSLRSSELRQASRKITVSRRENTNFAGNVSDVVDKQCIPLREEITTKPVQTQTQEYVAHESSPIVASGDIPTSPLASSEGTTTELSHKEQHDASTSTFTNELLDDNQGSGHAMVDRLTVSPSPTEGTSTSRESLVGLQETGLGRTRLYTECQDADSLKDANSEESESIEGSAEDPHLEDLPDDLEHIVDNGALPLLLHPQNESMDNENALSHCDGEPGTSQMQLASSRCITQGDCDLVLDVSGDKVSTEGPPTGPPTGPPPVLTASAIRSSQGSLLWKAQVLEPVHLISSRSGAHVEILEDIDRLFDALYRDMRVVNSIAKI